MELYPACLIESIAGRDKKQYLMVFSVVDENYVLLTDGKGRTIEKPKKKKIKHIRNLNYSLDRIREKLESGKKLSNSDIRKAIRSALVELGILDSE